MAFVVLTFVLVLSACGDDAGSTGSERTPEPAAPPVEAPETTTRVDDLVSRIASPGASELAGKPVEIDAYITQPARTDDAPGTPPQGCPVVPERLELLTDEPIHTGLDVAGASLPNPLATDVTSLRLVVPYSLGFIDVPQRALLRGHVLDPAYAGCAQHERFFILEEIVEARPVDRGEEPALESIRWDRWNHAEARISVEYPNGWDIDQNDDGGAMVRVRFLGPDGQRPIRLTIEPGEVYWHPAPAAEPPRVLRGSHREPAVAGQARARLVTDATRTVAGEQELRLVFNHAGNTVSLAMIIGSGADLDRRALSIFSEMAHRIHLDGEIAMTDPMDPVLAASDEIGQGPFLSEGDARYVAVNTSGMTGAETLDAELVSERDARMAVSGACRDFEGTAEGVWLVTVSGTLPSGREAYLLVYLDATTGEKLCQAEARGVS